MNSDRAADRRSGTGDRAADPERWVDKHGDCLYRYAMLRLRSPDLSADVVQETFLEALRARDTFEGRSTERTWLVGILRHKILDQIRRAHRGPSGVPDDSVAAGADRAFDENGRWRSGPASWGGDPGRAVETREFWGVFHRCLAGLPADLAETFFLRELDGMGSDEVQAVLGITPANLWTRLHRARGLLRQCLESHWFGRRSSPPSRGVS